MDFQGFIKDLNDSGMLTPLFELDESGLPMALFDITCETNAYGQNEVINPDHSALAYPILEHLQKVRDELVQIRPDETSPELLPWHTLVSEITSFALTTAYHAIYLDAKQYLDWETYQAECRKESLSIGVSGFHTLRNYWHGKLDNYVQPQSMSVAC